MTTSFLRSFLLPLLLLPSAAVHVCDPTGDANGPGEQSECCTVDNPCPLGVGDCNSDDQCQGDLSCAVLDQGQAYGYANYLVDVCGVQGQGLHLAPSAPPAPPTCSDACAAAYADCLATTDYDSAFCDNELAQGYGAIGANCESGCAFVPSPSPALPPSPPPLEEAFPYAAIPWACLFYVLYLLVDLHGYARKVVGAPRPLSCVGLFRGAELVTCRFTVPRACQVKVYYNDREVTSAILKQGCSKEGVRTLRFARQRGGVA